jgi:hypothetical protein
LQRIDLKSARLARSWSFVLLVIWLHFLWFIALTWQGKLVAMLLGVVSFYLAFRWLNSLLIQSTHLFINPEKARLYDADQQDLGCINNSSFVLGNLMWLSVTSKKHIIIMKDSVNEAQWRLLARVLSSVKQ